MRGRTRARVVVVGLLERSARALSSWPAFVAAPSAPQSVGPLLVSRWAAPIQIPRRRGVGFFGRALTTTEPSDDDDDASPRAVDDPGSLLRRQPPIKAARTRQWSTSDVLQWSRSPFAAWMDALQHANPRHPWCAERDPPDPLLSVLAAKGRDWEAACLAAFRGAGYAVTDLSGSRAPAATLDALREAHPGGGRHVIYQAPLADDLIYGVADFLVRESNDDRWTVWDSKLAGATTVDAVTQVCCYRELLLAMTTSNEEEAAAMTGRVAVADDAFLALKPRVASSCAPPPEAGVEGTRVEARKYGASWRRLRSRFGAEFADVFDPTTGPPAGPRGDVPLEAHGRWQTLARRLLAEEDDVGLVYGVTAARRDKLRRAGYATGAALAEDQRGGNKRVPGLAADVVARLKTQAKLQRERASPPAWRRLAKQTGPLVGPASPWDSYFDLEGDPFSRREYLWGVTVEGRHNNPTFSAAWAHDSAREVECFDNFVDAAYDRFVRSGGKAKVYHYGHYELAALARVGAAASASSGLSSSEAKLDEMLRAGGFVDLYAVVRKSLQIGEPSLSLKSVEKLYRPAKRDGMGDAQSSVVAYDAYLATGDAGLLDAIEAYNKDDCDSTRDLVHWLRGTFGEKSEDDPDAAAADGSSSSDDDDETSSSEEEETEEESLADRAARAIQANNQTLVFDASAATAALGWLAYHRRELKPLWRQRREWFDASAMDLAEDERCVGACRRTDAGVDPPKGSRARRKTYGLAFEPGQPTRLAEGTRVFLRNDDPDDDEGRTVSPPSATPSSSSSSETPAQKKKAFEAPAQGTVATIDVEAGVATVLATVEPPERCSLVPDEFVNPEPLPTAVARNLLCLFDDDDAEDAASLSALADFVARRPPRLRSSSAEAPTDDTTSVGAVCAQVAAMDATTLAVQGPPGTGKTFVAASAIADLLERGLKVACAAPSHDAIEQLTRAAVERRAATTTTRVAEQEDSLLCYKIGGAQSKNKKTNAKDDGVVKRKASLDAKVAGEIRDHKGPALVGATAWALANPRSSGTYDYLFVDEAGQVPAANIAAMASCATNIVLVGDQAQLPAPTRAAHPEGGGDSALEYLLGDERGTHVFLDESRRLRPELCDVVSELSYDGRLRSHAAATARRLRGTPAALADAGIALVHVDLSALDSDEPSASPQPVDLATTNRAEASAVAALVASLVGTTAVVDDDSDRERTLSTSDVLVVAPYNAHARAIEAALRRAGVPPGVRVGTVDRFQGKEAPVVVASMCAAVRRPGLPADGEAAAASSETPFFSASGGASSSRTGTRAVAFVLDHRRLNVAISRAQCLAVVVASPHIADATPSTLDAMGLVARFARLEELAASRVAFDAATGVFVGASEASEDTTSPWTTTTTATPQRRRRRRDADDRSRSETATTVVAGG